MQAVGVGATFIRLGGLCRGERVAKLNRLLQIEAELLDNNMLDFWPEHEFPIIAIPHLDTQLSEEETSSPTKDESGVSPRRK